MQHERLKPAMCLNCGSVHDAATDMTGDTKPSPGDVSVCFKCGYVMIFADDMTLRDATPEERQEIDADRDLSYTIWQMQEAVRRIQRK